MIVGITGRSGSGKTTLAKDFESKGYTRISIDEIGWQVIEEKKDEIFAQFGILDRKQIGDKVFNDRKKYKELVSILWERQQEIIDEIIKSSKDVVIEFILLPKTKYWKQCDMKILCTCDTNIRKERVLRRDHITEVYFWTREEASIGYNMDEIDRIYNTNPWSNISV